MAGKAALPAVTPFSLKSWCTAGGVCCTGPCSKAALLQAISCWLWRRQKASDQ